MVYIRKAATTTLLMAAECIGE